MVKVCCENKLRKFPKMVPNSSKMVSDQNENYFIGITIAENPYRRITVPHFDGQGKSLFRMRSSR